MKKVYGYGVRTRWKGERNMGQGEDRKQLKLPVLAMRGMVLFPQMVHHFDVGRDKSILALNEAMNDDGCCS
jgi:ATP-dependent Lon protease